MSNQSEQSPKKRGPKKGAPNAGRPKTTVEERLNKKTFTSITIQKLYEKGLTDKQVADILEMSERQLTTWKQDEYFSSILKQAKEVADDMVCQSLFKNAIGYSRIRKKPFHYQGKIYYGEEEEFYKGETAAQFIWLKNRRPDEWRDKIENTGNTNELDVGEVHVHIHGSKSKLLDD